MTHSSADLLKCSRLVRALNTAASLRGCGSRRHAVGTAVQPRGFTVMETVVALAIMTIAMLLVAQIGYWSLRERARTGARQVAIELAANTLESARARPWEELTPEWAATLRIPEALSDLLPEGKLAVRVEAESSQPHTKRVTVEITWLLPEDIESRPVRLVGLFTARSAAGAGGTP